ncbi:hypothetical protein [Novosphingobium sp. BL-52-GroH]|uniref:hypothetical protein n=1 Tax=Novosphingobium sp. BL-52-GroH TaxID=3349877 RepID=UPI00384E88B9
MSSSSPECVCTMDRCRQLPSVAFALVLPALVATPAQGRTEPSLTVDMSVFASPDPLLLSGSGNGAVMFEIAASPGVTITTDRGSTIALNGTLKRRDFSRLYGHYLLGDATVETRYRDSEYLTIGGSAGFDRALAIDLLSTSADLAVDPGAIRNSWFAGFDADWRPNAFELFRPEIRFDETFYSGGELLRDSRALAVGLAYSKRIGPRTSVGVRVRDTVNRVDGMASMNSIAAYGTYNRRFSGNGRFMLELGAERAGRQIETIGGMAMRRPGRTLLAGRVDLCRDAATGSRGMTACLSGTLNTEVSGVGGLRRNATVSASLMQPLGEKFVLRGSGDYRRSTLVGGSRATGPPDLERSGPTDAMRGTVALDWKPRRDFTVTASVQYLRRQVVTGQRIGAAFFGIQLSYRPGERK